MRQLISTKHSIVVGHAKTSELKSQSMRIRLVQGQFSDKNLTESNPKYRLEFESGDL